MAAMAGIELGIDLGGTKIELVAISPDGAERLRLRRATPRDDYEGTLAAIAAMVADAERDHGPARSLGIGTPGSRSPATGRMKNCNSTWLNGRPLQADLELRLGRRIALANDADCFTLSEARDGAAAGRSSVFGVILGTGVGGGLSIHGRLLDGPNGLAGEWGHNPLPPMSAAPAPVAARQARLGSRDCYCGRRDCIETWLSGPGLARTWEAFLEQMEPRPAMQRDARDIGPAIERGEASARAAFDHYCWQLAAALATIINVLDPHAIVLGGGVSELAPLYDSVPERWRRFVFAEDGRGGGAALAPGVAAAAGGAGEGGDHGSDASPPVVATALLQAQHGAASGVRGAAFLGRDARAFDVAADAI